MRREGPPGLVSGRGGRPERRAPPTPRRRQVCRTQGWGRAQGPDLADRWTKGPKMTTHPQSVALAPAPRAGQEGRGSGGTRRWRGTVVSGEWGPQVSSNRSLTVTLGPCQAGQGMVRRAERLAQGSASPGPAVWGRSQGTFPEAGATAIAGDPPRRATRPPALSSSPHSHHPYPVTAGCPQAHSRPGSVHACTHLATHTRTQVATGTPPGPSGPLAHPLTPPAAPF